MAKTNTSLEKKIQQTSQKAADWLLHSGIQSLDRRPPQNRGGFYAWYDVKTNTYPFIYAEITGYLTTLMLFLHQQNKNELCLKRANSAGDWIMDKHKKHLLIPCLFPVTQTLHHFKENWAYAFDNGILVNTLVNLYRYTKKKIYLTTAKTMANWMIKNLQRNDGAFFFAYNLVTREKLIDEER